MTTPNTGEPGVNQGVAPTNRENYPEAAHAGPDVTSAPVDLYATSESPAPGDLGYGQRPMEEDLWSWPVGQAHDAIGQMNADPSPHDAEVKLDGPFTTDTTQDGLRTYGT